MQIEDIKRWQWALLGLVAGFILSYAWQDHDVVGDKSYEMAEIKQKMFERESLSKSRESGQAILQNVRVEPPVRDYADQLRQIVIGKRLRFNPKDQKEYLVPFYYYASIPYRPLLAVPDAKPLQGPNDTVMDYLAEAQVANKLLHYRYAWELENNWFTVLCAIGGFVLVGGVWPTVLNILLGAGLGRPPKSESEKQNEDYLKRFGKGTKKPQPVLAAKGPTEDERNRLDEMNAALESQLAAAGILSTDDAPRETADDSTAGTVVVPLNAGPAEPAPRSDQERREGETEEEFRDRFAGGDFYPVSRGNKKE